MLKILIWQQKEDQVEERNGPWDADIEVTKSSWDWCALYPAFLNTDVDSELVQETFRSLRCPSHSPILLSALHFPASFVGPCASLVITPSSQDFHQSPHLPPSLIFCPLCWPSHPGLCLPQLQDMVEALTMMWVGVDPGSQRWGYIWVCEKPGGSVPWPPSGGKLHLGLFSSPSATLFLFFSQGLLCQPPLP